MSKAKITVVLPAAGYGTRMGSPEAKEMLINPKTGKKFIQFSLEQAKLIAADIVLIIRKEKQELKLWVTEFCVQNDIHLKVIETQPTTEWPETVLASEAYWGDYNILLLPDTDWQAVNLLKTLVSSLLTEKLDIIYAVFKTDKLNWGFVRTDSCLQLCEKPTTNLDSFSAWGIIGFTKEVGNALFKAHLDSTFDHQIKSLTFKAKTLEMSEFNDRTRGPSGKM